MIYIFTPQLSLIAKVPPFFKNFTIKNYYDTQLIKEALGAHMRPYGYTYHTPSWDGALQCGPHILSYLRTEVHGLIFGIRILLHMHVFVCATRCEFWG